MYNEFHPLKEHQSSPVAYPQYQLNYPGAPWSVIYPPSFPQANHAQIFKNKMPFNLGGNNFQNQTNMQINNNPKNFHNRPDLYIRPEMKNLNLNALKSGLSKSPVDPENQKMRIVNNFTNIINIQNSKNDSDFHQFNNKYQMNQFLGQNEKFISDSISTNDHKAKNESTNGINLKKL